MGLMNFLKGVWGRLFPIKDIKTALNVKIALTETMLNNIQLWQNCYCGNAPWLNENKGVISLRLEKAITREFSNIVMNEMTVNIDNDRLNELYIKAIDDIYTELPSGLGTGAMIIKPLGEDKVQYLSADEFIPVEYDTEGRLLKVIFPDFKKIGDTFYTRLEFHSLDETGLTITNTAYMSSNESNLGREVPLTCVDEWKNIPPVISYPLMKKQAFGYYRNPIKNTIDKSKTGVSIFESALELIKKADEQFVRLDWEFESGERAIYADETVVKKGRVARLKDRLFKTGDFDGGSSGDFFKEFSPQLRQSDYKEGLNEYKREIEFVVGLSYGDISDPSQIEKTAEEVKTAKKRKYNTVTAIQNNLQICLEELVYALAFYNSMATVNYNFACTFKDSILVDEETERKQDIQDVNMGVMSKAEYRAKWYGEDEETAKSRLPENSDVIE